MTDALPSEDPRDAVIREQAERLALQDEQIAGHAERIAVLEAVVADLRERLESALRAGSRNSGNSSVPPSMDDQPGRKPPRRERRAAERAAGKRKQGKQPGSPGASMMWEVPDRTEDHFPEGACPCGADLAEAADLGTVRSFQQEEVPAASAERVQHDLHEVRCACGLAHAAPRPAGVPDSALSVGPRLRALAVYLVVFQHVPVERCRLLIADVTGAAVSDGFVHSCLARAASLAAEVVTLIRALITASAVAGFDETTLRSGPAGEKKYVHGAFTELYSSFRLGSRSLDSMENAGILPDFAGIVVSDRYQNYFSTRWEHIAGNQACLAHLLRDYEDCAESYPGAVWPAQAQRALRGMIRVWHAALDQGLPVIPGDVLTPLEHEFRHAVLAGLASVPRVPGPKNTVKQKPGRELLEFCRDRRADVLRFTADTRIWPTNNISERGVRPLKPSRRSPAAWPATTSPRTASTSAATSTPPASTDTTPWTSCTSSWPAHPGDRQPRHSPRNRQQETAPPITTRVWAECLPRKHSGSALNCLAASRHCPARAGRIGAGPSVTAWPLAAAWEAKDALISGIEGL